MFRPTASLALLACFGILTGCSSYQPTKDVWKGTKGLWYTYASPPASINYEDKGELPAGALKLSKCMLSVDLELEKFERIMLNADRPPTNEWLSTFLSTFPWMSGITGVKYDGTILGQEPPTNLKELDYNFLLYEDKKQKRNALRGDVQNTPLGPEVLLAAPLYEGVDFLGIVCAHFDMRNLATMVDGANDLVILTPQALLWPGSYQFSETPLAGQDWQKICHESTAGTCTNAHGSFIYQVRYLGNIPLIFAVAESGNFGKGDGSVEQGKAYFPQTREKLPPPPVPEHRKQSEKGIPVLGGEEAKAVPELLEPKEPGAEPTPVHEGGNLKGSEEIQPGSAKSPLLKTRPKRVRRVERVRERDLEGENVRLAPPTRPQRPVQVKPDLDIGPKADVPTLPGGRLSPFGTRSEPKETTPEPKLLPSGRPNPFGSAKPKETNATPAVPNVQEPAKELPGGRPNPFGSAEPKETKASPAVEEPAKELPGGRPNPFGTRQETKESAPEPKLLPGGRPNPFGS